MDKFKFASMLIIIIYFLSLTIYITTNFEEKQNIIMESEIFLEFYYDHVNCSKCEEINQIIQDLSQSYKKNITIIYFDITNTSNLNKMKNYSYETPPLIVIKNVSKEQYNSYLIYNDTTNETLINELEKHLSGNYTEVQIELFIYNGACESCDEAKERVEKDILPIYGKDITLHTYKIDYSDEYKENYIRFSSYGFKTTPGIVIKNLSAGDKKNSILTYSDIINTDDRILEKSVEMHLSGNYSEGTNGKSEKFIISTPLGQLDLSELSLPIITIILGSIDSVNPCSFFVLLFLLSIIIYTRSRKRMLLIGSIFIFFSGFIYFMIMLLLLQAFKFTGEQLIITIIAGIIAIIFGVLNVKDYFFFKKGPSASIPDSQKSKLYKQMRKIVKITSIPSLISATIILALSANTVELLCSLNLPVIYTAILLSYNLNLFTSYIYLLIYNIFYVIPLMVIVAITVITLGHWKLSEYQGRLLKLFSGIMIFSLGEILLLNSNLLSNFFIAIYILIFSLFVTFIIYIISKKHNGEI
jgi:thiol-disulfide isomerase/thioredoxin